MTLRKFMSGLLALAASMLVSPFSKEKAPKARAPKEETDEADFLPLPVHPPWPEDDRLEVEVTDQYDADTFRGKAPVGSESHIFWRSVTMDKNGDIPFRIAHIDAPERNQAHGRDALEELRVLFQVGDLVIIRTTTCVEDRYRRTIAEVRTVDGIDVAHAMIRTGNAWWAGHHQPSYSARAELADAQEDAQEDGLGLWSAPDTPVPPWIWRQRK